MESIGPKWIVGKLEELRSKGLVIEKMKKFRGYDPFVQLTLLNLSENIGNIIGFDNVVLEPVLASGDADIKFVDDDVYYLQVKSPSFLRSKYSNQFIKVSKEFDKILSKKSRFAVGYVVNSSLIPIYVKDINKQGRKASLGILAFDTSFVPTRDITLKFIDMLSEANRQLGKIREKGWKIFILDTTHYPTRGNLDFFNLLTNVFLSTHDVLNAIDGLGLFSWNPAQRNGITIPSTIIPVLLKRGIASKVFKQHFYLYRGMMITLPTSMYVYRGWNNLIEIDKAGYIGVNGIEYGPFWEYVKLLSLLNELLEKYRLYQAIQL
jgi:hypothetical protein